MVCRLFGAGRQYRCSYMVRDGPLLIDDQVLHRDRTRSGRSAERSWCRFRSILINTTGTEDIRRQREFLPDRLRSFARTIVRTV